MKMKFATRFLGVCSIMLLAAAFVSRAALETPASDAGSAVGTAESQSQAALKDGAKPVVSEAIEGQPTAPQAAAAPTSPVPEPGTILAGALLLVPFGASAWRILRRNRAA
jgi:hypothetical protein